MVLMWPGPVCTRSSFGGPGVFVRPAGDSGRSFAARQGRSSVGLLRTGPTGHPQINRRWFPCASPTDALACIQYTITMISELLPPKTGLAFPALGLSICADFASSGRVAPGSSGAGAVQARRLASVSGRGRPDRLRLGARNELLVTDWVVADGQLEHPVEDQTAAA